MKDDFNIKATIQRKVKKVYFSPTQILVLGFLTVILIGAVLLDLPYASQDGKSIGFVNALFTSTSAVCVTGLAVVNTLQHWTLFGKIVIMSLIQIGGLGFMTLATSLFIVLGKKITLKERLIIQEALNQYSLAGMVKLIKNVILGTLLVEGLGLFFLAIRFIPQYGIRHGFFMALFHAISAFCNAGFDIVGDSSLTPYVGDVLVNFTIMALIILGGLGFAVWLDIIKVFKEKIHNEYSWRKWFRRLTLHTKLVLVLTLGLIIFGFLFFFIVEYTNPDTLGILSFKQKIIAAMFQSVTTRTAGFNTIAQNQMHDSSKFMTIILMFIGGSPAGTAGGIKTVTAGVLMITILSVVRGKERTEIFERSIPTDVNRKALAVLGISLMVIIFVTMMLSIAEKGTFMDLFFEATSAFGTVGLTVGVTPNLTVFGKLLISFTMFIGRLGPVTMAAAFTLSRKTKETNVKKPDERVMVG